MNIRLLAALLVGTVLGVALYAAFRGDLVPDHPAFESAAHDEVREESEAPSSRPGESVPAVGVASGGKPASSTEGGGDLLIAPGERVGKLTPEATEEQLRQAYGNENVGSAAISLGEGETAPGTVIFSGSERELQVVWTDADAKRKPLRVMVIGRAWRTRSGIGIGSTLEELEKLNGKPFALAGFGWDYGGTVVDWRDGELADEFESLSGRTFVRLRPKPDSDYSEVLGDSTFLSSEPAMHSLAPSVGSIVLQFVQDSSPESELAGKLVGRWTRETPQEQVVFELRADGSVFLQGSRQGAVGNANGRWAISGRRFTGRISASNMAQFPIGYSWSDEVVSVTDNELVLRNHTGQLEEYTR